MGRRAAPRNPAGIHFLRSRFAADLVRLAGVGPDDLVLDLGAGLGALTAPLAATGARVVANIPFATTTALLRRLLDPPRPNLASAYLVVERGAARRLAARSRDAAGAWWGARFELREVRHLSRGAFAPPPTVDAEVLAIGRYALPAGAEVALRDLLRRAGREPDRPLRALLAGRLGPGELRALGLDPRARAGTVSAAGWRAVALATRRDAGCSRSGRWVTRSGGMEEEAR